MPRVGGRETDVRCAERELKAFFEQHPLDLLLKAVSKHTDRRFVLLYVERWLKAPLQREDGTVVERVRGTSQGSAISPCLANLFLHYAFDTWMARNFPGCPFERYADDGIIHCTSKTEAQTVLVALAERLSQVGLELNSTKTRIVYCKDANRTGSAEHEQFDFLGYTFRPRLAKNKHGQFFVGFLPAVSDKAAKAIRQEIRRWRLNVHSDKALSDLASFVNPIVRGCAITRASTSPGCTGPGDASTTTSFVGPVGSSRGCGPAPAGRGDGCEVYNAELQRCSPTGRLGRSPDCWVAGAG